MRQDGGLEVSATYDDIARASFTPVCQFTYEDGGEATEAHCDSDSNIDCSSSVRFVVCLRLGFPHADNHANMLSSRCKVNYLYN